MCVHNKPNYGYFYVKEFRIVKIQELNKLKPDPYDNNLLEPIETETESFLKFRTGTEEF